MNIRILKIAVRKLYENNIMQLRNKNLKIIVLIFLTFKTSFCNSLVCKWQ